MLLSLSKIAKAYGDNQVLNNVTFSLQPGNKWGLVGANGVGKSTLLKIIVGAVEPDEGSAELTPGVTIGYLPQVLESSQHQTLAELVASAQRQVRTVEARLRALEEVMATSPAVEALLAEYGQLSEEFERLGGYDLEHRTAAVMAGLGLAHLPPDRVVGTLSGGEKARAGLAALLLAAPDLLLLDEPTNHLDFEAMGWLESYLHAYRGAFLVVSHDRHFLNATVDAIVELDEHTREATFYAGSYDFYAAAKAQARVRWAADYAAQQEEIHELRHFLRTSARQVAHNRPPSDGDKFIYNFKGARVDTAVARNVHAAEEKLRRMEADPIPRPPQPLRINPDFDPAALAARTPLSLSQVRVAYGARVVLDEITVTVGARDRIVIVGPNGSGKSTLLKVMAQRLRPDAGAVSVAPSAVIGYLDQEQETLPATGTLFAAYRGDRVGEWEEIKAELLRYGLFTWPDLLKPVHSLSVGQQRKLQLAQLIACRANLLLLDEPTNHISFDVLEEFEQAILDFPGAVVAVSHDRRFIARVAEQVWEIREGRLVKGWGDKAKLNSWD